jgi:hypothetical protein
MSDDLTRLIADLDKAPKQALKNTQQILETAAHKIKEDASQQVAASPSLKGARSSIDYDSRATVGTLRVEVGFNKGRPGGPLGNIIEFGLFSPQGAFGGGKGELLGALEREIPAIDKQVGDMMGDLI